VLIIIGICSNCALDVANACFKSIDILLTIYIAGDSGIGEESSHFVNENTDGRFYMENENIHVLLEFSHKYVSDTRPKYLFLEENFLTYLAGVAFLPCRLFCFNLFLF